jgi:hypothetical protein
MTIISGRPIPNIFRSGYCRRRFDLFYQPENKMYGICDRVSSRTEAQPVGIIRLRPVTVPA